MKHTYTYTHTHLDVQEQPSLKHWPVHTSLQAHDACLKGFAYDPAALCTGNVEPVLLVLLEGAVAWTSCLPEAWQAFVNEQMSTPCSLKSCMEECGCETIRFATS